jgi:drug/metabolite transporter (DMT)-like permease
MQLTSRLKKTPPQALAYAPLAFALFTGMDCTVRAIGDDMHVIQVVWMQTLVMLAAMMLATASGGCWRRLETGHPFLHVARGLLVVTSISLVFASYAQLPLSDVYAVLFTVPLLVSALGVLFLGERVSGFHWLALLAGFGGVIVMTAPFGVGFRGFDLLLPIGGALSNALGFLLVRRMQKTETTESMGVYGNLVVLLTLAPVLPFVFEMPTPAHVTLSVAGGLFGAAGFASLVMAYRSESAACVASFQYSQLLWAVILGLVLFQDQPDGPTLIGAAIVVASGCWLLRQNRANVRAAERSPAASSVEPHPALRSQLKPKLAR